jgi:hypothetical protein
VIKAWNGMVSKKIQWQTLTILFSSSKLVADLILKQIQDTPFKSAVAHVAELKDSFSGSLSVRLRSMDNLANYMAKSKSELKELIAAIVDDKFVDEYWKFFLHDAPENQLVRPDEYNYVRNFIQGPFWIALLLTKLGVPPPPTSVRKDYIT